jgi:hypothetical protein
MEYRKYAWPSEGQFITDMLSAGFATMEEDQVTFVDCYVHQIGLVENDPRWAVDIIFYQEIPAEFLPFVVWPAPNSAVHWFAGWESNYAQAFCEANPTLCNEATGEQ